MTSMLDWRLHPPIGIAIARETLYVPGAGTWPLTPWVGTDDGWETLREALIEARKTLERTAPAAVRRGRLAVALLPPLSMFRVVQLPKLRDTDLSAVLARNVTRYFPAIRERQTIAARKIGGTTPSQWEYAVVAAPTTLLLDIQSAARAAGWTVEQFVPAYAAWATTASRRAAQSHRDAIVTVRRDDGGIDVLRVAKKGVPKDLRRLRADDPDTTHPPMGATRIDNPGESAARSAPRTHQLALETEAIQAQQRVRRRRARITLAAAAVVVFFGGMIGFMRHTSHELQDVNALRRRLREPVAEARQLDSALTVVAQPSQLLAGVEERGPRWSVVINDLATALPPDAFMQSLRASHDTITIDGAAEVGARVFQAVGASDILTNVTQVGSIRRDASSNNVAGLATASALDQRERFALTARVAKAAPLVPPPTRGKKP